MRRIFVITVLLAIGVAGTAAVGGCGSANKSSSSSTTSAKKGDVYTDSGPIQLKPGERATIKLAGNATTGYSWNVVTEPDAAVAKVVSNDYVADANPDGKVGVGGQQVIVLEGVAKGTTTLTLDYKRPWETAEPASQTAEFPITVS